MLNSIVRTYTTIICCRPSVCTYTTIIEIYYYFFRGLLFKIIEVLFFDHNSVNKNAKLTIDHIEYKNGKCINLAICTLADNIAFSVLI
jgi:hypothetical protein